MVVEEAAQIVNETAQETGIARQISCRECFYQVRIRVENEDSHKLFVRIIISLMKRCSGPCGLEKPLDARYFFDSYLVRYSSWREIVEVLQYTHVWNERCIGRIMSKAKAKQQG